MTSKSRSDGALILGSYNPTGLNPIAIAILTDEHVHTLRPATNGTIWLNHLHHLIFRLAESVLVVKSSLTVRGIVHALRQRRVGGGPPRWKRGDALSVSELP
eukprot:CAMPEP_0169277732 /NCGR_PEP_ID=MMETSP1016-20121227/53885_1 /TAXON_ID=342587 /ORGANISM="Karlodinium micrum, Strain CCMP2283" /LENGTH=101 /DNA_ID=CAMNT_0009365319 /DNA_START=396 /DNA_END=699 /DNA_ORIENTATION=-